MDNLPILSGFQIRSSLLETETTLVWRAYQKNLERQVLITEFKPEVESNTLQRRQLFEAIRTLSNFKTSLFPDVIDILCKNDRVYIILEDANITNILALLNRQRLNAEQLTQLAMQLAEGFMVLQEHGLIYGAFSPKRFFLTEDSAPILPAITFIRKGNSLSMDTYQAEFAPKDVVWFSPEQSNPATVTLDTRTDIFSVGLSLYALATGQIPFGLLQPEAIPEAKLSHTVPSPCDISPNFPPPLAAVLAKMTQRDPLNRYNDWDEVRFALYQAQRGIYPDDPSPETSVIAPPRKDAAAKAGKTIRLSVKALRKYRTQQKPPRSAATYLLGMAIGLIILIFIALTLFLWSYTR